MNGPRIRRYQAADRQSLTRVWDDASMKSATRSGRLQIRDLRTGDTKLLFDEDLSRLQPAPAPPPAEARRW